jgi:hypothetical protein
MMMDPKLITAAIVGAVDWHTAVSGFCRCPGEALHTQKTGRKDCRVCVDGAPTIYCFHASCVQAVAEANRSLRRALGACPWTIALPGGRVLRSGDLLQSNGTVKTREEIEGGNFQHSTFNDQPGRPGSPLPAVPGAPISESAASAPGAPLNPQLPQGDRRARSDAPYQQERLLVESVRIMAERFRPELFEVFRWPFAQILEDSPLLVAGRDAEDQFRTWLKLWPAHCHVWVGDICSSGLPRHATHFRSVADWYQIGPVMGNYTCGSSFKPGSFQRSNENCIGTRFLVVESDTLKKDEIGAVFAYLNRRLHFNLHAIIDTGGKSLHGWFDAPRDRLAEARLKATLTAFGCDPRLFTPSQPVRVPGAWRDGKLQRLVWLKA